MPDCQVGARAQARGRRTRRRPAGARIRAASADSSNTRARRPNAATRPSEPGDARLDAWAQRAAGRPRRPHDVPPLQQPPRQPDLRAAAGRGEAAG